MSKCVKCGNEILTGDIHWEMGLCNSCYNELYKDHKTHISLDKMWLELAQSFRDENEKLQDKIADLEAKLAESNESHHKNIVELTKIATEKDRKIEKLKQQLAEKDQTIETILKENEELVKKHNVYTWGDEIQQDKIYAITGEALDFLINSQDKISFAVEKLEKVKEYCNEEGFKKVGNGLIRYFDLADFIDNQIKLLKEGK